MPKPAGASCNLRCEYCFYLEKQAAFAEDSPGQAQASQRMSDELLETYVRKYIESQPGRGEVAFMWQGGEPTLMGLEFFEKAVRLQDKYAAGRRITNSLQTNGTLLDDGWGRFLHERNFLLGLSLDGPAEIHNAYRRDASGAGSFDAVMRGLDVLKRHEVEFNILASVTPAATAKPLDVYRFFREAGVKFIQFLGIVERLPDDAEAKQGLHLAQGLIGGDVVASPKLTPWSVGPVDYGRFLCEIFDEWLGRDVGSIFVMNFEWAMAGSMGRPAMVCKFMPQCGSAPVVEHNGEVYSCDHYVYPRSRLGNIATDDLREMMASPAQRNFGQAKMTTLPKYCRNCPVLASCWGGCPKHRFMQTPDGQDGLNYLCAGYRKFFLRAAPHFQAMAALLKAGRPAAEIMRGKVISRQ